MFARIVAVAVLMAVGLVQFALAQGKDDVKLVLVRGAQVLTLGVEHGGFGDVQALAAWANARLILETVEGSK